MDRIDAMTAFVATVDGGGFSVAARRLGRSPASITRAVAFLEARTGSELLRRTTRVVKVTAAGERYLAACRRILSEIAEAENTDPGERTAPRGTLTITAPQTFGRLHVRPLVDAFLGAHDGVRVRLLLLDRVVDLVDEGVDIALRIAHLPDSALVAIKVGDVRRVVCASRAYLERNGEPKKPSDLADHDCVSFSQMTANERWRFAGPNGRATHVAVRARMFVNGADAAIGSAVDGHGVTSALSYQVDHELRHRRLVRILRAYEPPPVPVHLVFPAASGASAKVRAFVESGVPVLRAALAKLVTAGEKY